jgi:hypothetical protein
MTYDDCSIDDLHNMYDYYASLMTDDGDPVIEDTLCDIQDEIDRRAGL